MMKFLVLTLIMMSNILIILPESAAQTLKTSYQLVTSGGYVTNTWLNPALSEWDRSSTSAFFQLSPAIHLQFLGTKQTAAVSGMAHFHHLTDGRPDWAGGTAVFNYRRIFGNKTSFTITAGANRMESSYRRDLHWVQSGIDWLVSPEVRLEFKAGSNWRTYSDLPDTGDVSNRYDSYGIDAEYWISPRWQFGGRFYSSLDHITKPGKGFASSLSLTHRTREGLIVTIRSGLEQFSQEFQSDVSGGFPPVSRQQTLTIEDRFVRSGITGGYPVMKHVTLNGGVTNLLWMSSSDQSVLSDIEISAGVEFSFSPLRRSSGSVYDIKWEPASSGTTRIGLRFRGGGALYLTGDFNDWEQPGIPLQKTGRNTYKAEVKLEPGVYQYKVLIRKNGGFEWVDLAGSQATIDDGFGGRNGKIIIGNNL
jgi:hypothetical protein